MAYISHWDSPLGPVLLAAEDRGLTGLWFLGQKHVPDLPENLPETPELPVFVEARAWLERYFAGRDPGPTPPLCPAGTAFQRQIWQLLTAIPYGKTTTYGDLAEALGRPGAAQAVGGAVGRNPISILIPCHRVLARDGGLTGYAGGSERKQALLELEKG